MSDQSLTLDSWWLLITLVEVVIQFDATRGYSSLFILAFFAYLFVRKQAGNKLSTRPVSLLLLRVFGHRVRSRKLLDLLGQRWRYLGSINLIGAPDVATSHLEPDTLVRFWTGRGRELFISDNEELERRLKQLDTRADPDQRFRINQFFCYDNTWRQTVGVLAQSSEAILMDLRGFGPDNRGCQFELGLLLTDVPLEKTVLLIDDTTDNDALEKLLTELWEQLPSRSPNYELKEPKLSLFEASGSINSVAPLLSILTGAGVRQSLP